MPITSRTGLCRACQMWLPINSYGSVARHWLRLFTTRRRWCSGSERPAGSIELEWEG
jgi:hypothetical protein